MYGCNSAGSATRTVWSKFRLSTTAGLPLNPSPLLFALTHHIAFSSSVVLPLLGVSFLLRGNPLLAVIPLTPPHSGTILYLMFISAPSHLLTFPLSFPVSCSPIVFLLLVVGPPLHDVEITQLKMCNRRDIVKTEMALIEIYGRENEMGTHVWKGNDGNTKKRHLTLTGGCRRNMMGDGMATQNKTLECPWISTTESYTISGTIEGENTSNTKLNRHHASPRRGRRACTT